MAFTKPEQPTAASKHDTEEDTREACGTHRKQAAKAPTHRKAGTFKNQCLRTPRVHKAGPPNTTSDSAYMFETGFRTNLFGIAVTHWLANRDWVLSGN